MKLKEFHKGFLYIKHGEINLINAKIFKVFFL